MIDLDIVLLVEVFVTMIAMIVLVYELIAYDKKHRIVKNE